MKPIFNHLLPMLFFANALFGQEYTDDDALFGQQYETPLTIDLEAMDDLDVLIEKRKKKPKANVFYGKKTRKGFTKTGFSKNIVIEQFRYLKEYEDPEPYVRDIYWYDFKKRKIIKSRKIDKSNAAILHGPYQKMIGDQVIEEGIFYRGTKHGRWTRWNKHNILQSKEKYYKGWPKLSMVAYYNRQEKQLMEIIPIQFGEKEGNYYAFHESGNLAAVGEFRFDHKVGIWREYHDHRNRRKREIIYSTDPFDDEFAPYISREWDERGKLIYDRSRRKS